MRPFLLTLITFLLMVLVTMINSSLLGRILSIGSIIIAISIFIAIYIYFISSKYDYKNLKKYSDFCNKNITTSLCTTLLSISGVLIRYFYIIYTKYYERQHDINSFEEGEGHLGYMWSIYKNSSIPDVDPRDYWQFAHPPLHHIIEAVWFKLIVMFGVDENRLHEYTQIPVFIYGCITMFIMYKILKEMELDGKPLVLAYSLVCFNPTFIIMSGSINNDMLSSMFICFSILYAIKWHKNPNIKNIIIIALAVGLGMMSKLSAGFIAPAIAFVFMTVLIRKLKVKDFKFISQYVVFLLICVPLGLWWCIRNYVKFDLPFNYVTEMDLDSFQYLGNIDLVKRFTDFSQASNIYVSWNEENIEFNPIVALLKTSVFGEFSLLDFNSKLTSAPSMLFDINTIVVIISFISMIFVLFKDKSFDIVMKIFWSIIFITFFTSYIILCITYPFTCSMNIRYVTVLITTGILFIGKMYSMLEKSKSAEFFKYIIIISGFGMSALSLYCYTALAVQ